MSDEFLDLDATAQAEHVRAGDVTPAELVEASIARVEAANPRLNAVIHPLFDKARAAARQELPNGPFRGVPFLVKDAVCHTEGDPYHIGMRFLKEREHVADSDTELARRFRAAGFVFVGKTNTPELAMSATTEPLAYGATHNPWNLDHSPGGSSGGSAAAVAAGLVAAAHANDMGGSIRVPASFCSLVGLKPTRARGTLAPSFGEYWGPLTHEHVVTRSVRDSAAILDAIAGRAPGDPYSAPPPLRPFADEVGAAPGRLRIGFTVDSPFAEVDPECERAVRACVDRLSELGHEVVEKAPDALSEPAAFTGWIAVGLATDLERIGALYGVEIGPDDVEPMNWTFAEIGKRMSAVEYANGAELAHAWSRRVEGWWAEGFDVLVTPTSPVPPPRLGELAPEVPSERLLGGLGQVTAFTMPFDITGQPAISLPLHWSDAGLPIGVQFAAEQGREDLLFRLAAQLEEAMPWRGRRPPAL